MDEPKMLGADLADNGDHRFLQTQNDLWGFEPNCDVKSQRLFNMMISSMLKLALDGAGKVFMDPRRPKTNLALCESRVRLASDHGEVRRSSLDSTQGCENNTDEERRVLSTTLQDNGRVCKKSGNSLLHSSRDFVRVSEVVNSPSGRYNPFHLNILAFTVVLLMKIIRFQLSLVVSFFTFPIWLLNFSFMLLLFPFQTLRLIRRYLMKKLLRMWSVTSTNVTSAVSAQKSLAVNVGWALFRSIYVCSMLFGILASGFVLSGFMMRQLVDKPIQTTETLNFDYTKSSPVAFVPLMSFSGVGDLPGLNFKDNVAAGKRIGSRFIPYNHKLQLTVSLTVPESEYNHKLGVFQVRVEFLSANGNVTASSSYPCMLRFKSKPIQFIQTFLRSAPLVAGLQAETQVLNIKMSEYIEGLEPTACLKVKLEQRAEFQSVAGIPQIYAGSLVLKSELPQLKRFVWYWRRTIFVWTSIVSFLTELVFILAFFRPMIVLRGRPKIGYSTKKVKSLKHCLLA